MTSDRSPQQHPVTAVIYIEAPLRPPPTSGRPSARRAACSHRADGRCSRAGRWRRPGGCSSFPDRIQRVDLGAGLRSTGSPTSGPWTATTGPLFPQGRCVEGRRGAPAVGRPGRAGAPGGEAARRQEAGSSCTACWRPAGAPEVKRRPLRRPEREDPGIPEAREQLLRRPDSFISAGSESRARNAAASARRRRSLLVAHDASGCRRSSASDVKNGRRGHRTTPPSSR